MRWLLGATFVTLLASGCGDPCDAGQVSAALAAAAPGSVVTVGSCAITGPLRVPAGVTLRGAGPEQTTVSADGVALTLGDGAAVESLRVDHASAHGIVATSVRSVTVRDVEVHSTLGRAALGFADVETVTLSDVHATGPITSEADATRVPDDPGPEDTALYGIVLMRVGRALLTDVTASGFGAGGVVSSETSLEWTGGGAISDLSLGVWIDAGSATLTNVEIRSTLRGFGGTPPFGLAIGRDADVHTSGLLVDDSHQGFGILQDGGRVEHMGLVCSGHTGGGMIVQRSASFRLGGGSSVMDNSFAGIVAVEAAGVTIESSMVADTTLAARLLTSWGGAMIGDGIQIVEPAGLTTIRDVDLVASGRVGMLADLGGGDAALVSMSGVSTTGTMQYGCLMQNGTGITSSVSSSLCERDAPAVTADAAAGSLDVVGIIMPAEIPDAAGLVGIIMPVE